MRYVRLRPRFNALSATGIAWKQFPVRGERSAESAQSGAVAIGPPGLPR